MSPRLMTLLQHFAEHRRPISLRHVEDLLRQERFSGPVTIHYRDGVPKQIEAGKPLKVDLAGEGRPEDLTTSMT